MSSGTFLFGPWQENSLLSSKINHVPIKLQAGPSIIVVQVIQLHTAGPIKKQIV